jgi:hypothetical protein
VTSSEWLSIWNQHAHLLSLAALAMGLLALVRYRSLKRALPGLVAAAEQRTRRSEGERVAELEGRVKGLLEAHQSQWEEWKRQAREAARPIADVGRLDPDTAGNRLDRKHQVLALAQMGLGPRDISRKLRLPLGETELLLGIWENFKTSENQNGRARLQ